LRSGLVTVHAVGQGAEGVGDAAHGGDGFAADLGNDRIVQVGDGMAQLHLDELKSFIDSLAD
jgi:hypothetical protein